MIEKLTARVAELERQLGRNSRNSSQPPSADGPEVSPSPTARRRSGRNPGKQPGAGGSALFQTSTPDEVVDHVPDACSGCGSDLNGARPAGGGGGGAQCAAPRPPPPPPPCVGGGSSFFSPENAARADRRRPPRRRQ